MVLLLIGLSGASRTAVAQSNPAGQWPQWRGPNGTGVSTDSNLPEQWSHDSANIKWKAKLPGEGHSSPIVSGNRVFVTTAYENPTPGIVRRVTTMASCLLAAVFLAAVLARRITGRTNRPRNDRMQGRSPGRTLNVSVAGVSSSLFFLLLVLLFVFPGQYDATAGKLLAQTLGTYDTEHVFYIGKDVAAATWLKTGADAQLGLAAALYWLRARSIWRPIGGLVFVVLTVAFVVLTPQDAWKYPIVLWTRLLFVVPASLVAAWHLVGFLEIRFGDQPDPTDSGKNTAPLLQSLNRVHISCNHKNLYHFGGASSAVLFVSMAALAALAFVPANLIVPKMGVRRAVVCLDFTTGETLWQTLVFAAPAERKHRDNSYATPTPATDGQHVVANFGAGAACFDLDGRMLWKVLDPLYPDDTRYGAAASVLIWKDRTIILQESEERTKRRTWLAAFDTASGDLLWKVWPGNLRMAYTTGLLHDDGTGTKLIIASYEKILCFELESGRLLWQHDIPMQQIVASLTRAGSTFCVGGGTWGPEELIAFKPADSDANGPVEELWQASEDTPGCASPVMHNEIVFTITDTGVMRAYDAATGKLHWRKRLGGRYLASPVAGEGKVNACNTHGQTTVVAAEPQLRILGRNRLQGDCRASFAVADSHFLVRTSDFLYCIAPNENRHGQD